MPQARQGGSGVCAFAIAGSKSVGVGFENEHIGHIHVAPLMGDGADGAGVLDLCELIATLDDEETGLPDGPRDCGGNNLFEALGYSVSLGDDLRNPAERSYRSTFLRSSPTLYFLGSALSM